MDYFNQSMLSSWLGFVDLIRESQSQSCGASCCLQVVSGYEQRRLQASVSLLPVWPPAVLSSFLFFLFIFLFVCSLSIERKISINQYKEQSTPTFLLAFWKQGEERVTSEEMHVSSLE